MRHVVLYPGEDGHWVVECPSLPGCISQGMTEQEALENIEDAIKLWMADALERNDEIPGDVNIKITAIEFPIDGLLYHELESYAYRRGLSIGDLVASWTPSYADKEVRNAKEGPNRPRPKAGSAKGLITISADFDAPLDDFAEYMP